jgi:hypothetical protein
VIGAGLAFVCPTQAKRGLEWGTLKPNGSHFTLKSACSVADFPLRNSVPTKDPWGPHISLVFREMWDTTNLSPELSKGYKTPEKKNRGHHAD